MRLLADYAELGKVELHIRQTFEVGRIECIARKGSRKALLAVGVLEHSLVEGKAEGAVNSRGNGLLGSR